MALGDRDVDDTGGGAGGAGGAGGGSTTGSTTTAAAAGAAIEWRTLGTVAERKKENTNEPATWDEGGGLRGLGDTLEPLDKVAGR